MAKPILGPSGRVTDTKDQAIAIAARDAFKEQQAVMYEALRLAKNTVREDIRAKGLRLKDYEAKEVTELAWLWFLDHRAELIGQATIGLLFAHASVRIHPKIRTLPSQNGQLTKANQS